jgi:hypothetical protein
MLLNKSILLNTSIEMSANSLSKNEIIITGKKRLTFFSFNEIFINLIKQYKHIKKHNLLEM